MRKGRNMSLYQLNVDKIFSVINIFFYLNKEHISDPLSTNTKVTRCIKIDACGSMAHYRCQLIEGAVNDNEICFQEHLGYVL